MLAFTIRVKKFWFEKMIAASIGQIQARQGLIRAGIEISPWLEKTYSVLLEYNEKLYQRTDKILRKKRRKEEVLVQRWLASQPELLLSGDSVEERCKNREIECENKEKEMRCKKIMARLVRYRNDIDAVEYHTQQIAKRTTEHCCQALISYTEGAVREGVSLSLELNRFQSQAAEEYYQEKNRAHDEAVWRIIGRKGGRL